MKQLLNLFIYLLSAFALQAHPEIVVIIPTYNNERYCIQNLESLARQSYQDWVAVVINDCSTDRTSELIHHYVAEHALDQKIKIIDNTERKGALCNLYETIHLCADEKVIVTYDGDDTWFSNRALERIAQEYHNPQVWITYGQFMVHPSGAHGYCRAFPPSVLKNNKFRSYQWVSSHPRTFKAWLFKKIKREDLIYEDYYFPVAWDLAIMFPMLEMASRGHIRFIPDPLYLYNAGNPLNDHKVHADLQQYCNRLIRAKTAYKPL